MVANSKFIRYWYTNRLIVTLTWLCDRFKTNIHLSTFIFLILSTFKYNISGTKFCVQNVLALLLDVSNSSLLIVIMADSIQLTILGLYGGLISLAASLSQSMVWKKA